MYVLYLFNNGRPSSNWKHPTHAFKSCYPLYFVLIQKRIELQVREFSLSISSYENCSHSDLLKVVCVYLLWKTALWKVDG